MRIIHGELSGRIPRIPGNLRARPTTDLARGALFNILLNRYDFPNLRVLDLFAGTGCISYEFGSLGTADITCVELDRHHCMAIRENARLLGLAGIKVVQADVFRYLNQSHGTWNVIFADPPFDHKLTHQLPDKILETRMLENDGSFILEHDASHDFSKHLNFKEIRTYGKVRFSFFGY